MEHLRKGDPLSPPVLRPEHLVEVLLPYARPVRWQQEGEPGERNLMNGKLLPNILALAIFWQMVYRLVTSPLPEGSSTLQHSLEEEEKIFERDSYQLSQVP